MVMCVVCSATCYFTGSCSRCAWLCSVVRFGTQHIAVIQAVFSCLLPEQLMNPFNMMGESSLLYLHPNSTEVCRSGSEWCLTEVSAQLLWED